MMNVQQNKQALRQVGFSRRIRANVAGIAITEFAIILPFLLVLGTGGLEAANYVMTWRRVSDLTSMVADNASRLGAQSVLTEQPVSETDINSVFTGARLQANSLDIPNNGRIILSSLERNADGGQWVRWQRCFGAHDHAPLYGAEGAGETGTAFQGMGQAGSRVVSEAGSAVMFVEFAYKYEPLFPFASIVAGNDIVETASFNIRGGRDLDTITNVEDVEPAVCN